MDRLTKNFNGAFGLVKVKDNEQEIESPYRNTLQACFESWQRLGQYEDTGLTPEEIAALRAEVYTLQENLKGARSIADQAKGNIAEVERLRVELEAAKRDIKNMLQSERCEEFCAFCKRSMDDDCSISNCNAEWRGMCAENGGTE